MTIPLFSPSELVGGRDVKSLVLRALSEKSGVSAKQLHNLLSNTGFSYQAIHKVLGELEKEGVVERDETDYRLSLGWLESIDSFVNTSRAGLRQPKPGFYSFDYAYAAEKFVIDLFLAKPVVGRPKMAFGWSHFWIPLFIDEYIKIGTHDLVAKYDIHSASYSDSPIDRWCDAYWQQNGLKTRLGVENLFGDIVAGEGVVATFHYPSELERQINAIYAQKTSPSQFDTREFYNRNFKTKSHTFVSIVENKEYCDRVTSHIYSYFKKPPMRHPTMLVRSAAKGV